LIDDETKLSAFKFTIPQWLNYFSAPCFLRVRGRFAEEAIEFCTAFQTVKCVRGSDFIQWRRQSLWDTKSINTHFIFLYLEDHMVSPSAPNAHSLLTELLDENISIFQYSWFPQYSRIRDAYSLGGSELISIKVASRNLDSFLDADYRWIISMTSIFEKDFLRKLLRSSRPFLRRKDPKAPYEIEQSPESTWYLPINFGISRNEIGISMDDENGVEGYSAIARGLYSGIKSEWAKHHEGKLSSINLSRQLKTKMFPTVDLSRLNPKLRLSIINVIFWPSYLIYSLKAIIFTFVDFALELFLMFSNTKHRPFSPDEKGNLL
jgi:hypothetical protein